MIAAPSIRSHFGLGLVLSLTLIISLAQLPHNNAHAQTVAEKWAVVVGVGEYNSASFHSIPCAETDARDLTAQLERFFGEGHVLLLANADATRSNIGRAICEWMDPREDSDDVVLFFFSGHGSSDYLYPYDSLTTFPYNYIKSSDLDSWLDLLESKKIALILNSCNAGDYVNQLDQPGRILLTCGDSGETCWGCTLMKHSYFTNFIIEAIGNIGTLDSNLDNDISVEEVFNYASLKMASYNNAIIETHGQGQHPKMIDNCSGELVFSSATVENAEGSIPNVQEGINDVRTGYPQFGRQDIQGRMRPAMPPFPPNIRNRMIRPFLPAPYRH